MEFLVFENKDGVTSSSRVECDGTLYFLLENLVTQLFSRTLRTHCAVRAMGGGLSVTADYDVLTLKSMGDSHYRCDQFYEAIFFYTSALGKIEMRSDPVGGLGVRLYFSVSTDHHVVPIEKETLVKIYGNRSAAYSRSGSYQKALNDAGMAGRKVKMMMEQFEQESIARGRSVWALYSALTAYSSHADLFPVRNSSASDNIAVTLDNREREVSRIVSSDQWRQLAAA